MQHGSIPLESRVEDGCRYLKEPAPGAAGSASLAELGVRPELSALKELLVESFEEALGVRLETVAVTPAEAAASAQFESTKYRNDQWNLRGMTEL
jgi:lipoate-protein ligase A